MRNRKTLVNREICSKWSNLYKLQNELNEIINQRWLRDRDISHFNLAIYDELIEIQNSFIWKWWKLNKSIKKPFSQLFVENYLLNKNGSLLVSEEFKNLVEFIKEFSQFIENNHKNPNFNILELNREIHSRYNTYKKHLKDILFNQNSHSQGSNTYINKLKEYNFENTKRVIESVLYDIVAKVFNFTYPNNENKKENVESVKDKFDNFIKNLSNTLNKDNTTKETLEKVKEFLIDVYLALTLYNSTNGEITEYIDSYLSGIDDNIEYGEDIEEILENLKDKYIYIFGINIYEALNISPDGKEQFRNLIINKVREFFKKNFSIIEIVYLLHTTLYEFIEDFIQFDIDIENNGKYCILEVELRNELEKILTIYYEYINPDYKQLKNVKEILETFISKFREFYKDYNKFITLVAKTINVNKKEENKNIGDFVIEKFKLKTNQVIPFEVSYKSISLDELNNEIDGFIYSGKENIDNEIFKKYINTIEEFFEKREKIEINSQKLVSEKIKIYREFIKEITLKGFVYPLIKNNLDKEITDKFIETFENISDDVINLIIVQIIINEIVYPLYIHHNYILNRVSDFEDILNKLINNHLNLLNKEKVQNVDKVFKDEILKEILPNLINFENIKIELTDILHFLLSNDILLFENLRGWIEEILSDIPNLTKDQIIDVILSKLTLDKSKLTKEKIDYIYNDFVENFTRFIKQAYKEIIEAKEKRCLFSLLNTENIEKDKTSKNENENTQVDKFIENHKDRLIDLKKEIHNLIFRILLHNQIKFIGKPIYKFIYLVGASTIDGKEKNVKFSQILNEYINLRLREPQNKDNVSSIFGIFKNYDKEKVNFILNDENVFFINENNRNRTFISLDFVFPVIENTQYDVITTPYELVWLSHIDIELVFINDLRILFFDKEDTPLNQIFNKVYYYELINKFWNITDTLITNSQYLVETYKYLENILGDKRKYDDVITISNQIFTNNDISKIITFFVSSGKRDISSDILNRLFSLNNLIWKAYFDILNFFTINFEKDIYQTYINKNILNIVRQELGYGDDTKYIKETSDKELIEKIKNKIKTILEKFERNEIIMEKDLPYSYYLGNGKDIEYIETLKNLLKCIYENYLAKENFERFEDNEILLTISNDCEKLIPQEFKDNFETYKSLILNIFHFINNSNNS